MEVIIPSSFTLTMGALATTLVLITGAIRAYFSLKTGLNNRLQHLEEKIDKMAKRNERADEETAVVKTEQATQRTTIAVMAEQMQGFGRTLERIDGNVTEIVRRSMKE